MYTTIIFAFGASCAQPLPMNTHADKLLLGTQRVLFVCVLSLKESPHDNRILTVYSLSAFSKHTQEFRLLVIWANVNCFQMVCLKL